MPEDETADLLNTAWAVIANAMDGKAMLDGKYSNPQWIDAAEKWRDRYHVWIKERAA